MPGRRVALSGWLLAVFAAAGCASPPPAAPVPAPPPSPSWTEVVLPGAGVLRDVARCSDRWIAAGGASAGAGPAAWTSVDGRAWSPLPVTGPAGAVLVAVACRDGVVAALGALDGGFHDGPRAVIWRPDGGGLGPGAPLRGAGALAARRAGWLATDRDGGVWLSPDADAGAFARHDDPLGLRLFGVATVRGASAGRADWLLVGDVRPAGAVGRQPAVWGSTGGLVWSRATLPAADGDGSVGAVAVRASRYLAVGTLGGAVHAWFYDGFGWRDAGGLPAAGPGVPAAGDVAIGERTGYLTADDGAGWALWTSADLRTWRRVETPVSGVPLLLAGSDDLLVLAAGARVWAAPPS